VQRAHLETETEIVRLPLPEGPAPARIIIDETHFLFTAQFKKSGPDLILTGDDGKKLVITDYFNLEKHPDLVSPDGAIITADLVQRLAGPDAPGQYAQAGAPAGALVIGRVEVVSGRTTVQHANGVVDDLKNGDSLLKGDVVMTGDGEGCTLSLIDGTALNMGANARMVLAELAYESNSTSNSALINLVKGSFVFVAGQVAHTGDMKVSTPVATMGIRGTTVGTYLDADVNGNVYQLTATLLTDPSGGSGAYDVMDPVTGVVLHRVRSTATQVTLTHGSNNQLSVQESNKSPAIVQHEIAIAQILFPIFLANPNNVQLNQTTPQAPNNSLTPPQLLPQPPQETDSSAAGHFNALTIGPNNAPVTNAAATVNNNILLTTTTETNAPQSSTFTATLTFTDANIGRADALAVQFTVGGLNNAGNGTITFSDGNHANDVVVQIVNGLPVGTAVNLSGMTDGPITATLLVTDPAGNTFHATASAQLDQDLNENPTVAFAQTTVGRASAAAAAFLVLGLESDDNGTITFSDGNHAHDVVVNIVNGVPVSNTVNLSGMTSGVIKATLSTIDPAGNQFHASASTLLAPSPTVTFAETIIGSAHAAAVLVTVSGVEIGESGTITFSDGNPAHDLVVGISNPGSTNFVATFSEDFSGFSDGVITATLSLSDLAGNQFQTTTSVQLDQDLNENPTIAFEQANIGPLAAASVVFAVNGLERDDNGTITFSDGNHAHDVIVNIVNGVPVTNTVNLSGLTDGPITASLSASDPAGNHFLATATAQLDQDIGESAAIAFADANIGRAKAGSEQFTVSGLGSDDNGAITFSDGNPAHNVVVNIVNGASVGNSVNLSGMTDGPITATLLVSDAAGNMFSAQASAQLDQDIGEQASLHLTVDGNSATPIGAAGAVAVSFAVAGLDSEDTGTVTFTDAKGTTIQVSVNGTQTSYTANFTSLADGVIKSSLSVNPDPAGNTFTPVLGNSVTLAEHVDTVTITGASAVGQTVIATVTDFNKDTSGLTYQWFDDGVAIAGAISATYAVIAADAGHALSVTVTETDQDQFTSVPVTVVSSQKTWKNNIDGDWSNQGNWNSASNTVPSLGDDALINANKQGTDYTVHIVTSNDVAHSLTVTDPNSIVLDTVGGDLNLGGGTGGLTVAVGIFELWGGSFEAGTIYVQSGGELWTKGNYSLSETIWNDGVIEVGTDALGTGTLHISGTVAGAGTFQIDSGAGLQFDGPDSANVVFNGSTGTLILKDPGDFTGTISGLTGSDSIDLANIQATTAEVGGVSYSNATNVTTLTVTDGYNTDALHLVGDYTGSSWSFSSDSSGGTVLVDPVPSTGGSAAEALNDDVPTMDPGQASPALIGEFSNTTWTALGLIFDHAATAQGLFQEHTSSGNFLTAADVTLDQFHFGNMDLTGLSAHASGLAPAISGIGSDHFQFAAMDIDGFHQAPMVAHPLELDLQQAPLQEIVAAAAPAAHDVMPVTADVLPVASVLDVIHAIHAHTA
jgi:hypothetical protein